MAHQKLQIKNKYLKLLIKKSKIKKGGGDFDENNSIVEESENSTEGDKRIISSDFPNIKKQINLEYGGGILNFKRNGIIIQNNHIYRKEIPEQNIQTIIFTKVDRDIGSNQNLIKYIKRDGVDLTQKQLTLFNSEIYNDVKNILITYAKNVNTNSQDKTKQKISNFLANAIFDSIKIKNKNKNESSFSISSYIPSISTNLNKSNEKSNEKSNKQIADFLANAIFDSIKQGKTHDNNNNHQYTINNKNPNLIGKILKNSKTFVSTNKTNNN